MSWHRANGTDAVPYPCGGACQERSEFGAGTGKRGRTQARVSVLQVNGSSNKRRRDSADRLHVVCQLRWDRPGVGVRTTSWPCNWRPRS